MARSLYKGERLGKLPPCAICAGPGRGRREKLVLSGGIEVWLCEPHRSLEFQRRRAGRDFVVSLMAVWRGAGCFTLARSRALDAHRERILALARPDAGARPRPGSYSWPTLRREAEALWAAGAGAGEVITRLRARERSGTALPPSRPTMYRWFREGRWLVGGGSGGDPTPPSAPPPDPEPAPPSDVEHGGGSEARLALLHVGDAEARQELGEARAGLGPDALRGRGDALVAPGRGDAAVDRLHHLEDGHLRRGPPEGVAALHAALALQDARTAQAREELLQEVERDRAGLGDLEDRDRPAGSPLGELRQRDDGGAALLGDRDQGGLQ
jgi:hypothetical protein